MGFADQQQGGLLGGYMLSRAPLGVAAVLFLCGLASADDALPAETLKNFKAATVFLKVEAGGDSASGSGFVIRTEGQTVHVVTNHHVVNLTPDGQAGAPKAAVTVVFNSGTKEEQSVKGEVVATDPRRDLAVVKVANVATSPPSIDLAQPAKLLETMPVYILGFPLGELLATNKGNPAVTVGKGSVASLRNNEHGELATIQIDGDMTPGNSGGPVVDDLGRLVGVTAATIRGRRIGFAIPAAVLTQGLKGRLLDHQFTTRPVEGKLEVRLELGLFDPFNQVKGVSFYYLPGDKPADKKLAGLPNVQKVNLERGPLQLVGNFTLKLPETGDARASFQAIFADGDNQTFVTNPRERFFLRGGEIPRPPEKVVVKTAPRPTPTPPPEPPSEPMVRALPKPPPPAEPRGKTTVDLMPLIDPAKDAIFGTWEKKDNVLYCNHKNDGPRIEIPFRPPEEYDFIVVFSQPQLRDGIILILPNPKGGTFWWKLGGGGGKNYHLGVKSTTSTYRLFPNFVEADKVYTTVVQVRRDSVQCLLNGQELVNRKTDFSDLLPSVANKLRDPTLLGVACNDPTVFYYVRLVEVTGKGTKLQ